MRELRCHIYLQSQVKAIAVAALLSAQVSFAEEAKESKVGFQINQSLQHWSKTSGDEHTSEYGSTPSGLELVVNLEKSHLHVFPVDIGSSFQVGYDVLEGLEFGVTLGLGGKKDDDKDTNDSSSTYGAYAVYSQGAGPMTVELGLSGNSSLETTKSRDQNGAEMKTNTAETTIEASIAAVVPVMGGFSYFGSVAYSSETSHEKESDAKSKTSTVDFVPVGIRLDF